MFADANCLSKCNANRYSYVYDHADRYTNSNHYSYRHTERYGYCYTEHYGNSYDYTYRHTLSDSYGYDQTNTYCAASPNTEATSHSAAASLRQPALVSWRADSGERTCLTCWFRRRAETNLLCRLTAGLIECVRKVRADEDASASTRDACATQERGNSQTETTALDWLDMPSHATVRSVNLRRITQHPRERDWATVRIRGLYSQRYQSATQPDNGNRRNRFLFADNSCTAPASIPSHEIG